MSENTPSLSRPISRLTKLGVLGAIGVVLMLLIHIPIFPPPFAMLEYDPADMPILIGTFLFGPLSGLALTLVVSVLQVLLVSPQSGFWGFFMHFCATGGMVLVAGLLYKRRKTMKMAVFALLLGALTMIVLMIPLNIFVTPIYTGAPRQFIIDSLLPYIIPFNAIKAFGNAILTFLLYKRVGRLMRW